MKNGAIVERYSIGDRIPASSFVQRAYISANTDDAPNGYTSCFDISKTERVWTKYANASARITFTVMPQRYNGSKWVNGTAVNVYDAYYAHYGPTTCQVRENVFVTMVCTDVQGTWVGRVFMLEDNTVTVGDVMEICSVFYGNTFFPIVKVLKDGLFAILYPSSGGGTMNSGSSLRVFEATGTTLTLKATAAQFAAYSGMGYMEVLDSGYILWHLSGSNDTIYMILQFTGSSISRPLGTSTLKFPVPLDYSFNVIAGLKDDQFVFVSGSGTQNMVLCKRSGTSIVVISGYTGQGNASGASLTLKNSTTFTVGYSSAAGIITYKEFKVDNGVILDTETHGSVSGTLSDIKYTGNDVYYIKPSTYPGMLISIPRLDKLVKPAEDVIEGITQTACTEDTVGKVCILDKPETYSVYGISNRMTQKIKDDTIDEIRQEVNKNEPNTETTGTGSPA